MYSQSTGMVYRKRAGIFKNSTGTVSFDPKAMEAYSYEWWLFVAKIKGKVVFNSYSYSPTTSGHQSAVRRLLESLGIKIDLEIQARQGLQDLESALSDYESELKDLQAKLASKRTKAEVNERRAVRVKEIVKAMKFIQGTQSKAILKSIATVSESVAQAAA